MQGPQASEVTEMTPTVYGSNHIAVEGAAAARAALFPREVCGRARRREGGGTPSPPPGPHQFRAISQTEPPPRDSHRHFGIIVKDDDEIAEVKRRLQARGIEL